MSELAAVAAVGFCWLALWYVLDTCTPWGLARRERAFLLRAPGLFETELEGYLTTDHFFLQEMTSRSWMSFAALNHFQSNERVAVLEWGSGAGGVTVLAREMFANPEIYARAVGALEEGATAAFDPKRLSALDDLFSPQDAEIAWPEDDTTIAECDQTITYREGLRSMVRGLPTSLLSGSRQIHLFFGVLTVVAIIGAEHLPWVPLTVVAIWCAVMGLAMSVLISNLWHLWRQGTDRMLASRTRFTADEIHIKTTVGYYCAPLSAYRILACDDEHILLGQGQDELTSRLEPTDFGEAQWQALVTHLRGVAAGAQGDAK